MAEFNRPSGATADLGAYLGAGTKINGRVANTNVGGLVVGNNDKAGVVADEAMMAVARVKQNVLEQSWIGAIATMGDPIGRSGSWLAGADNHLDQFPSGIRFGFGSANIGGGAVVGSAIRFPRARRKAPSR